MDQSPESALRQALAENSGPEAAAEALAVDAERLLIPWGRFLQDNELYALDHHRDGLAKLELLHHVSLTVGIMFDRDHVASARGRDEPRVNVLRQLWAASIEAGGESLSLLRSAYPSGALARWRLVREAEVLALLVGDSPPRVAEAFLQHSAYKATQLRRDYQAWAEAAGAEGLTYEEMREMGRLSGRLLAERPEWIGEYGWAHEALLDMSADCRRQHGRGQRARGPTFADVEAAVGQRPSKLFYALASQAVHLTLDAIGEAELHIAPRPDEIDPPAARLARSLPVPIAALVHCWPTPEPDTDYVALSELAFALSRIAEDAFAPSHGEQ